METCASVSRAGQEGAGTSPTLYSRSRSVTVASWEPAGPGTAAASGANAAPHTFAQVRPASSIACVNSALRDTPTWVAFKQRTVPFYDARGEARQNCLSKRSARYDLAENERRHGAMCIPIRLLFCFCTLFSRVPRLADPGTLITPRAAQRRTAMKHFEQRG